MATQCDRLNVHKTEMMVTYYLPDGVLCGIKEGDAQSLAHGKHSIHVIVMFYTHVFHPPS